MSGDEMPDEIIIYDDASDYPARDYAPVDQKIQVIRGDTNHGPAYGRDLLLNVCNSDYVHFHDADDLFYPAWCKRIRSSIESDAPDIIVTGCSQVNEEGEIVTYNLFDHRKLKEEGDVLAFFVSGKTNTQSFTFLKSLAYSGYDTGELKAALDYYFNCSVAIVAESFSLIDEPLAIERLRLYSLTRTDRPGLSINHRLETLKALNRLVTILPEKYFVHVSEIAAEVASQLFRAGKYNEAREGFLFSTQVGIPTYSYHDEYYRIFARYFGPMNAERVTALYRKLLPLRLRHSLFSLLGRGRR